MTKESKQLAAGRIDLAQSLLEIREIVHRVESIVQGVTGDPRFEVRLFGSWTSGNPLPHDIDIAIDGPHRVDLVAMAEIRDASQRILTLCIDLVNLAAVSEVFRR